MAFSQNDNSGALFKNDKKQEGDNRPNYRGSAKVGGDEVWVSAWLKKDRNGNMFMSLAFEEKGNRTQAPNRTEAQASYDPAPDPDDEMPF